MEVSARREIFDALGVRPAPPGVLEVASYLLPVSVVEESVRFARTVRLAFKTAPGAGAAYTANIMVGALLHELRLRRVRAYVRDAVAPFAARSITGRVQLGGTLRAQPDLSVSRDEADLTITEPPAEPTIDYDTLDVAAADANPIVWEGDLWIPSIDRAAELSTGLAPLEFIWTRTLGVGEEDKAVLILTYEAAPKGIRP